MLQLLESHCQAIWKEVRSADRSTAALAGQIFGSRMPSGDWASTFVQAVGGNERVLDAFDSRMCSQVLETCGGRRLCDLLGGQCAVSSADVPERLLNVSLCFCDLPAWCMKLCACNYGICLCEYVFLS
jgi:hypothetical protein